MNAVSLEVPISAIAAFSSDGRVFRAFGHLLGAKPGELLLVPLGRTTGNLRQLVDGCPVPWEEVWSVLDTPPESPRLLEPETFYRELPAFAEGITPHGWVSDLIPAFAAGRAAVRRFSHISGILFARV